MSWRAILIVYLKELKDTLRDRRAVLSMVIIPTVVMPGIMFGVTKIGMSVVSKARQETPSVMVLGGEDSPAVMAELQGNKRWRIVPPAEDWRQQISEKKLRTAVELPVGFQAGVEAGAAPEVVIYHYEGELKSSIAAGELDRFFRELRERTISRQLAARSLPATLVKPFDVRRQNVAPPEKVGGNLLGGIVPYIIIILCFTGAMYPAMDLTAGEKERGTMETLLCSPVARRDIVLGKFLMVLTGSLSAMLLSLGSMAVSASIAGILGTGATPGMAAGAAKTGGAGAMPMIDPMGLVGVVAMILPVAVLFSALLFTVSLFAKSYKEAQSYVGPTVFIVIIPAVIGMLPGVDLNARLALVPLLNLSLVCKEMLSGVWHWHYISLIFLSSCVYAGIALALSVRMFSRESVIFRS